MKDSSIESKIDSIIDFIKNAIDIFIGTVSGMSH
jgi:hypothetical protein